MPPLNTSEISQLIKLPIQSFAERADARIVGTVVSLTDGVV